jgi:hypothetical protein
VPIAHLERQWPGGPIQGTFTARYGPDNKFLGSFTMTADDEAQLPQTLTRAVQRMDDLFEQALADGKLRPDPTLNLGSPSLDSALQRLIEIGRAAEANERAQRDASDAESAGAALVPTDTPTAAPAAVVSSYVVQFASPDGGSVDATLATVRAAPGVRGAATSSLAIGGTSVMRVSYGGSIEQLAAALRGRGFTVTQGSNALAISR